MLDFMQSAQEEESSLDQAVNIGNRESREFHVIHFGSSIIMWILCNSHHFLLSLDSAKNHNLGIEIRPIRVFV